MSSAVNDGGLDEASLVKLYMDLTGSSEGCARSVYMFVCAEEDRQTHKANGLDRWRTQKAAPQKAIAQVSPAQNQNQREFTIGILARPGVPIAAK